METTEKQNATDDASGGSEAATSGESELDTLLKEYDTGQSKPSDVSKVVKAFEPVAAYAKSRMEKDQADAVKDDIDQAFKFVTEDEGLKNLKKSHVRGFLEAYGSENPEFARAFHERAEKPEQWNAVLEKGRDWMKEEISGLSKSDDKQDLEAATAAVSGTADQINSDSTGPSANEMFEMSDTDWQKFMDKELTD